MIETDNDTETCAMCGERHYRVDLLPASGDGWICLACEDYVQALLADT